MSRSRRALGMNLDDPETCPWFWVMRAGKMRG